MHSVEETQERIKEAQDETKRIELMQADDQRVFRHCRLTRERAKGKLKRGHLACAVVLFVLLLFPVHAGELVLTSFQGNGELAWSNSVVEGTATLEWSSSLDGPWRGDWQSLTDIPITNSTMRASVPLFYRIVQRQYAPTTNMLAEVAYDPADKAFYIANSNSYPNGYSTYQKDGPEYTFYVGIFEVSNAEFCEFLNDAQANPTNGRGTNMYFRADGNVYMNATMVGATLVSLSDSRCKLTYSLGLPIGSRYGVTTNSPQGGGTYSNHPLLAVSWYGAVKYCNWLTIETGRGASQRCYSEGPNPPDWAPVTAAFWDIGTFTDSERADWLSYLGFRLPMDHYSSGASPYNEFYKVAAWKGTNNTVYGYGRDLMGSRDANYMGSGDPFNDTYGQTTPVGYYDGSDHGGAFLTRANDNHFGVYDLTGNVSEWMNDLFVEYDTDRSIRSGNWNDYVDYAALKTTQRESMPPHAFGASGITVLGFRVVTVLP